MNRTTVLAALMMTSGLGRRTLGALLKDVSVDDLVDDVLTDPSRLATKYGLAKSLAERVPQSLDVATEVAERLSELGAEAIARNDERYPQRLLDVLGDDAPPVLFAKGNLNLAQQPAVGFCGSRKASEKGLRVARDASAMLAAESIVLVSGYASGVDLEVHRSALQSGGTTIFVLAEGILHFRVKREVAPLLNPENHLVLSEFSPRLTWQAHNAMQRNSTIIGLSDAMVVIESGLTGGTHACGEATLKFKRPLFVADYAVPAQSAEGNQYFLAKGALPLRGNQDGVPSLSRVLQSVQQSRLTPRSRPATGTLFPNITG